MNKFQYCTTGYGGTPNYRSDNIGDDIQSVAMSLLLGEKCYLNDRDSWDGNSNDYRQIVVGYHSSRFFWTPFGKDLLYFGFHLDESAELNSDLFQKLHTRWPVFARDLNTFHKLQRLGIPCNIGYCCTLSLTGNPSNGKRYAVDCKWAPPSFTTSTHKYISEGRWNEKWWRFVKAKRTLEEYRSCEQIRTDSRLHVFLPGMGMGKQVVLNNWDFLRKNDPRFSGYDQIFYADEMNRIYTIGDRLSNIKANQKQLIELYKQDQLISCSGLDFSERIYDLTKFIVKF